MIAATLGLMWRTTRDIAWFAGLYEGEGSLSQTGGPAKRHVASWTMSISSSDRDVLDRVVDCLGWGTIRAVTPGPNSLTKKPMWRWCLSTREEIIALLAAMYPFASARRQERFRAALASYFAAQPPGRCRAGHLRAKGTSCRPCTNARLRAAYNADPERHRQYQRDYKARQRSTTVSQDSEPHRSTH